ncbi:MAG TPA: YbhN family protein [Oxalicibacterium sp.]|nr:YbhN family protein [Oxalicibacterium sp.]
MNSRPSRAEPTTVGNAAPKTGITTRAWWPWAMTAAKIAFFVLVAWLLVAQARSIEWDKVIETVRNRPARSLLLASLLGILSYALYGCFDLLGRYVTQHHLPRRVVIAVNLICYAFNLNIGATVGGAAFRFRLYSRLGLDAGTTARIIAITMFTNWIGYVLLGGIVFLLRPLALPPDWAIGSSGLRVFGGLLLALMLIYLLLCAFASGRGVSFRGHTAHIPSLRLALLELAMSCANWLLISAVIYVLLNGQIAFTDVLSVLLVAAIAGVITHVPGGIGVIEAVFVALLSHRVPASELIASILMYRTIYYFVPLGLATAGYLLMEARIRKAG